MKRIHIPTILLLALILVLGYFAAVGQRREARLRAALAMYRERAGRNLDRMMAYPTLPGRHKADRTIRDLVKRISGPWSGFPRGVPVLVDPDGLREAGQTLDSPIRVPPPDPGSAVEYLTFGQRLRIVLEPLGLAAVVKDGAIVITALGRVDELPIVDDEE